MIVVISTTPDRVARFSDQALTSSYQVGILDSKVVGLAPSYGFDTPPLTQFDEDFDRCYLLKFVLCEHLPVNG